MIISELVHLPWERGWGEANTNRRGTGDDVKISLKELADMFKNYFWKDGAYKL